MNADLKRRWVEALRSGEYEQGQALLRAPDDGPDRFCCLGVLCDLVDPSGWWSGRVAPRYRYGNKDSAIDLPDPLRIEVGLSEGAEGALVRLNDDGKSFSEIADWIEANVEVTA